MHIDYLLAQSQSGLQFGYSIESGWITTCDEKQWPIEGKEAWKALPLLEVAPDETIRRLAEICSVAPETRPFPLPDLLRSALLSRSSYWAGKAAEWYPWLQDDDKRQLSSALSEVAQSAWATQKVRQFAEREAMRLMP